METYNLGKVAPTNRGAYSEMNTYVPLEMVSHNGGMWICIKQCTGVKPGAGSNWQTYWVLASKGVNTLSVSGGDNGIATMTVTYCDGTTSTHTFATSALAANSVGTNELKKNSVGADELKKNAVINDKIKDGTIGYDKLSTDAKSRFAPAYSFGTEDKVPGSPSTEPDGTIYWVVDSL